MRTPLKLNRAFWPRVLTTLLPSAADPRVLGRADVEQSEFSEAVGTLKFGTTYKTTEKARFPSTVQALSRLEFQSPPIVLDIGASDGVTSIEVMQAVRFRRYYVTDKYLEVFSCTRGDTTYFYDGEGRCILAAMPAWVVYEDIAGAIPPFGSIARSVIAAAPVRGEDAVCTRLVTHALRDAPKNVCVTQYDVLEAWRQETVDLVLAANLLSPGYFTHEELVRAVTNLLNAIRDGGRLVVVRNRDVETATIFEMRGGIPKVEHRIGGGSGIESLVLSCRADAPLAVPMTVRVEL